MSTLQLINQLAQHYSSYSSEFFYSGRYGEIPDFKDFVKNKGYAYNQHIDSFFKSNQTNTIYLFLCAVDDPASKIISIKMLAEMIQPKCSTIFSDYFEHALMKKGRDYVNILDFQNKQHVQCRNEDNMKATTTAHNGQPFVLELPYIKSYSREIENNVMLSWNGMKKIVHYMDDHSMLQSPGAKFHIQCFEKSYNAIKEADEFNRINYLEAIGEENLGLADKKQFEDTISELKETVGNLESMITEIKSGEKSEDTISELKETVGNLESMITEIKSGEKSEAKKITNNKCLETVEKSDTRSMVITLCGKVKFTVTRDLDSIFDTLDSRINIDTYDVNFYKTFDEAKEDITAEVVIIENIGDDVARAMKFFKDRR